MSSFSEVTNRLNIRKARVATLSEAENNSNRFDKYFYVRKSRAIKKIHGFFYIPNHLEPIVAPNFNTGQQGFIGYQYDFAFDDNFIITNADSLVNDLTQIFTNNADVCIRFRVGLTVFRYHLGSFYKPFDESFLFVPQYNRETIGKNFVIEVWVQIDLDTFSSFFGTFNNDPLGTKIETSLLFDPDFPEETERQLSEGYFVRDELFVALPEPIPTIYGEEGPAIDDTCGPVLDILGASITGEILTVNWNDSFGYDAGTTVEIQAKADNGAWILCGDFIIADTTADIDIGVTPTVQLLVRMRVGSSCPFTDEFSATIIP